MQTAVNPQTGETAILVGDKWQRVDQVATNPQGQKAYLVGGQWMTDQGASELPVPPKASTMDKVVASAPGRIARGGLDPFLGIAQLYRRGMAGITTLGGALPNPIGDYFEREAKDLDRIAARSEKDYQSSRQRVAQEEQKTLGPVDLGTDWMRLAGNVVSPANAWIAAAAPIRGGMSVPQLAGRGAVLGAAGAASQPVIDEKAQENFWTVKGIQSTAGLAGGAVATPLISKVTQAIIPRINALLGSLPKQSIAQNAQASVETDRLIAQALKDVGQNADDLPPAYMQQLRDQVIASLKTGKKLDPATVLRTDDFKALGISPTQGQVTRDATQFATERNLRGTEVGVPLMNRFTSQNQRLGELLNPQNPADAFQAGDLLSRTLKKTDTGMRNQVSALYKAAEQSSGKTATVPMQGLAQDAASVLDDFGDKVPSAVRSRLESFGLFGGKQTKVFNPEEADKLIKLINDHVGSDAATNRALDRLRGAVKKTMIDAPVDDVFSVARTAAAKRFQLQDLIPALEDAAQGKTAPDDFVRKFIINGKAREVQGMAELLRQTNPAAAEEAKKQFAAVLNRAAFGENMAGDKLFAPERFAQTLRNLGDEKLKAFFTNAEIEQFKRIARVAAYINSPPTAAPVNYSNTGAMVTNALGNLLPQSSTTRAATSLLAPILSSFNNTRTVNAALNNVGPVAAPNISAGQAEMIARLLSGGGVGLGLLSASPLQKAQNDRP